MTAVRLDGPRLSCGNRTCSRRLPGTWLVRVDDHPRPTLVLDRAWKLVRFEGGPLTLRLAARAARSADFLAGRREFSEYAARDRRRAVWAFAWLSRDPRPPIVCPSCGTPNEVVGVTVDCTGCLVGGTHAVTVGDVLHSRPS